MNIHSSHNADTYLYEMRHGMGSSTDFGVERFTGIVFGKFFCVSHHCSYDWESRYTCQKNTAIGIVKNSKDGCDVQFFVTRGDLRPQWLIPVYAIILIVSILFTLPFRFALQCIGIFTFAAIISAIVEPHTSASKDGYKSLISLIKNPQNPYENL